MSEKTRDAGPPNLSHVTDFSCANRNSEKLMFAANVARGQLNSEKVINILLFTYPCRETKFSGARTGTWKKSRFFPVQLTTSRIGSLTRLILTLAM